MPVSAVVAPPIVPPSSLTAAGWNIEASALVKELCATQHEVADLLSGQAEQAAELSGMKEACTTEVRVCCGWGASGRSERRCIRR